jgi:hypothetical protein
MRHTVLAFLVLFLFGTMALAADGDHRRDDPRGNDPKRDDPKMAVVGVWTMGFCQAELLPGSGPRPLPFGCTTQLVNFHKDGSVWSSYMFDQNPRSAFGGYSVGAAGKWHYLGNNQFFVTMLRFINDLSTGQVKWILRTDFTVEAYPKSDEAVTGKMVFLDYKAEPAAQDGITYLPYPVVKKDPYRDPWDAIAPGPTGIPMKRIPSFDPNSPVLP